MVSLLKGLEKIDGIIEKIQNVILLVGCAFMVVINGAQVFCRYVLHSSILWSEQVSIMVYFFLIMLGANLAVRSDNETKIDILKFRNQKINWGLHMVTDVICLIVLGIFMASSFQLLEQASAFQQYLSSIHLDYFYIYLFLPIGFALVIYGKIVSFVKHLCAITGKIDPSEMERQITLEEEVTE